MRKKGIIKFPLQLRDGAEARSMEELREHFDLEKIIGYFQDGRLVKWLDCYLYADEADEVRKLSGDEHDLGKRLCDILGAKYTEIGDTETIIWRKERLDRLKQFTADTEILNRVDMVAFDQDDLEDIIREEDTDIIYLCQNKFTFPSGILRKKNVRYVGIGKNVEVKAEMSNGKSFSDLNISFENVIVNEIRNDIKTAEPKSSTKSKTSNESTQEWWKQTDFLAELIYRVYSDATPSFFASWEKPVFLYNDTLKNTSSYRNFNPHLYLGQDETMICIMPVLTRFVSERYVVFTNNAVKTVVPENLHLINVNYSDIEDVTGTNGGILGRKILLKGGSSANLPCSERYFDAMRYFLLVATDKRSVLFENDKYLYNMKFDSLNGKTIGQMLVLC